MCEERTKDKMLKEEKVNCVEGIRNCICNLESNVTEEDLTSDNLDRMFKENFTQSQRIVLCDMFEQIVDVLNAQNKLLNSLVSTVYVNK